MKLIFVIIIFFTVACDHITNKTDEKATSKPNVLIILSDQWRASAFGFSENPDVKTPNIDKLAAESANCYRAVSGMPVWNTLKNGTIN